MFQQSYSWAYIPTKLLKRYWCQCSLQHYLHQPGQGSNLNIHQRMNEYIVQWNIQFSSVAQSCPTLCDPMNRSTPVLPVHHQLPESTQTHAHRVGDAIQPSHPPSSPSLLPPIPPSIRVFSDESTLCIRWPKYWNSSFSISSSNEYSELYLL